MRKLLVLLLALGVMTAADAQNNNKRKSKTEKQNIEMKTIQLTGSEFKAKVGDYEANNWKYLGDKPALVDFYADWCGPCKALAPVLEELAEEYDGQIYIYKINTDKERGIASDLGIRSIPSLLFIPMEGEPQMARGAMPREDLKAVIDEVLLGRK